MADDLFKIAVRVPKKWKESKKIIPEEINRTNQNATRTVIREVRNQMQIVDAIASRDMFNAIASRQVRNDTVNAWFSRAIFFKPPADRYWRFVNDQKNAGKTPIRNVGGHWEPLPQVIRWMSFRGIPFSKWFVIARAMAEAFVGYKFIQKAVRIAKPKVKDTAWKGVQQIKTRLGLK